MGAQQYESEPVEKRALRVQGVDAGAEAGTGNTAVIAFTGAAAAAQGTVYPPGAAFAAPAGGSGAWVSTVIDAVSGSAFKFNRKGIYRAKIMADATLVYAAGANVGITLDATAAQMLVAGAAITTLSDINLAFWTQIDTLATVSFPLVLGADVYITDALAAGAQPVAGSTGASGVGVLRFIASDNAGAAIGTAFVAGSYRATITCKGDQAG